MQPPCVRTDNRKEQPVGWKRGRRGGGVRNAVEARTGVAEKAIDDA